MRVVTPDVSVWKYLTSFTNTLGGFQTLVLIACVVGVVSGSLLWTIGASGNNGSIASTGRWAVIGSCAGAIAAANIPAMIAKVITSLS